MRNGAGPRETGYLAYFLLATCVITMVTAYPHHKGNQSESTAEDDDVDDGSQTFDITIIADLDKEKAKNGKYTWKSYLKKGTLTRDGNGNYAVDFMLGENVTSQLSVKGKSMELSELCKFNGKLYSVDDKTGVVYDLKDGTTKPVPWVILQNGNGRKQKPFKGEWMTVKGGILYVGGHGVIIGTSTDSMWVKQVTASGSVTHHDWKPHYMAIREKLNVPADGYITHEAVEWSDSKNKWFFLPRKLSMTAFKDKEDETKATNFLISANADFSDINVVEIGKLQPSRGFASLKFIPGTNDDVAIALRTEEVGKDAITFVTIFEVDSGKILLADQLVENEKYEGLAFT